MVSQVGRAGGRIQAHVVSLQSPLCSPASGLPGIKRKKNISAEAIAHWQRKGGTLQVDGERDTWREERGKKEER